MNLTTLLKQILFLLSFFVLSWILVHFLAIFGIFLALALPLLHLAFYPHILCFWCRLKGGVHTIKHSLIDSAMILGLTIISIPLVFLEYRLATNFIRPVEIAQVAQFMIPARHQYPIGTTFPLKIELMNIPAAINMVQADLAFDPQIIEVVDISTDGTFANFFVQKEFSNEQGYIRVTGGVPNPGYRQPTGLLATAYLRGKIPGAVELTYLNTSLILANDGRGSNLLSDYPRIPLVITPVTPSSSPTPADLTIRSQVQGDTDKTVLTFTEYAQDLPAPFSNTLGLSDQAQPTPTPNPDSTPQTSKLLWLDQQIISFWQSVLQRL